MQGPGRPDIVNAGSGETRYSECRVRGSRFIVYSTEPMWKVLLKAQNPGNKGHPGQWEQRRLGFWSRSNNENTGHREG
ncbi:unnamed protein product, partial [Staurois parvus]